MNPWWLLGLSALLLAYPWLLMPARRQRPEIHGFLRVLWWINALYCAFLHRLDSGAPAPLPEHGPAILVANHTCPADPMVLQAGCRRVLGFMIAKEFYDYWAFYPMCRLLGCIPVRRDGQDLAATRAALRALEQGRVLPVFPEGKILPTSGREIGPAKPGAAFLVLRAKVPVIPAYIRGTPETKSVWRALLTPSNARVVYGPPLDLSDIDSERPNDREVLAKVTERLMGAILDLRARTTGLDDSQSPTSRASVTTDSSRDHRRPGSGAGAIPGDRAAVRNA